MELITCRRGPRPSEWASQPGFPSSPALCGGSPRARWRPTPRLESVGSQLCVQFCRAVTTAPRWPEWACVEPAVFQLRLVHGLVAQRQRTLHSRPPTTVRPLPARVCAVGSEPHMWSRTGAEREPAGGQARGHVQLACRNGPCPQEVTVTVKSISICVKKMLFHEF